MLSKLFKSRFRLDELDAAGRRDAIAAINDEELGALQADLAELARDDADVAVRKAAITRLEDVDVLETLLGDPDPGIASAAAERLAHRAAVDPALRELYELPGVAQAALRVARELPLIEPLLARLDEGELARGLLDNRNPRIRLALAERIFHERGLTALERLSRGRDKSVNRLARDRLDELKAARAQEQTGLAHAETLLERLERLSEAAAAPQLAARLSRLEEEWTANLRRLQQARSRLERFQVAAAQITACTERFERLATRLRERLETHGAETGQAGPGATADDSGAEASAGAFETVLAELDRLAGAVSEALGDVPGDGPAGDPLLRIEALQASYSELKQRWLSQADQHAPPEALASQFHTFTHRLNRHFDALQRLADHAAPIDAELGAALPEPTEPNSPEAYQALWERQREARQARQRIERLVKRLDWPQELAPPGHITRLTERAEALAAFDQHCHQRYERLLDACQRASDELEAQIEAGHLNDAVARAGEGKRWLRCLPRGAARHHQQRLQSLGARLQELKDWHNFATGPKRRELCEQIEALARNPLEPQPQAERIKALRRAWNELGPITHHRDRRLLDRFNAAAEQAFEPCRAFFEAEANKRRFNLEQRETILQELDRYLAHNDWSNPDWKAAERILHTAQSEWRKFHPVDRAASRKTQQRFDALIKALHGHLKGEWDRNIAAKEEIVERTRSLRDELFEGQAPLAGVIERCKALQREWRDIGITPRGADQRLWKTFRGLCDDIFGYRDQSRDAQRRAIGERIARAEQLCEEFQERLDRGALEAADGSEMVQLRRDIDSVGELPREARQRLLSRLRELDTAYNALLRESRHRARRRELEWLQEADRSLGALEAAVVSGEIASRAELAERLAASGLTPHEPDASQRDAPETAATFRPRIETLDAVLEGDDPSRLTALAEAAREQRRRLTLETEIRAGLESPEEEQQHRLELRVQQLNQGLRQNAASEEGPLELARRWCGLGPWSADCAALGKRFFHACAELLD